jgi:hypothetical protein
MTLEKSKVKTKADKMSVAGVGNASSGTLITDFTKVVFTPEHQKAATKGDLKNLLSKLVNKAYTAVNSAMVEAYWLIGKRIVEEEQKGKGRAAYGKEIIKNLSKSLKAEFGKGYSTRSLREYRQFYQYFSGLLEINITEEQTSLTANWRTPYAVSIHPKWRTLFANLHWSHYQRVLRLSDENARMYYLTEAATQNWSISTLDRNISTLYYQRLITSQQDIVK